MTAIEEPIEGFKETEIGLLPEDWDVEKVENVTKKTKQNDPPKYPNHGKMFKAMMRSYLK